MKINDTTAYLSSISRTLTDDQLDTVIEKLQSYLGFFTLASMHLTPLLKSKNQGVPLNSRLPRVMQHLRLMKKDLEHEIQTDKLFEVKNENSESEPFKDEITVSIINNTVTSESAQMTQNNKIFIVHGHNNEMKLDVARFIEKQGLVAIILHEQISQGNTIIEKLEQHSDVQYAIVLVSPDDQGYSKKDGPDKAKDRARQNVIFELGFFYGKLGRKRVSTLLEQKGTFELHSDISGIVYHSYDTSNNWKMDLVKELKAAGYSADANKI